MTGSASATTSGTLTANVSTLYEGANNVVLISGGSFASGAPLYYEFSQTNAWSSYGYDWFALSPGTSTLTNGVIVLNPDALGTWYLLVSDSGDGHTGVISIPFKVVAPPSKVPYFEATPTGTVTVPVPGQTSNAPNKITVYGENIPASDSVTVYMVTGWTPSSPYTFPSSGNAYGLTVVASQSFTGEELDYINGASFTAPVVPGGDYGFFAVDTSTGTPIMVSNFESLTGFNAVSSWSSSQYGPSLSYTTASIAFSTSPSTPTNLQLFTVMPSIVYSVDSLSGSTSQVWSFTGYGFIPGDTFTLNTATVELGGVSLLFTSPATVGTNGVVTFSNVKLQTAITTGGYYTLTLKDDQGVSYPSLNGIYVSTPSINLGSLYLEDLVTGSDYGYVGDPLLVTVYNFPANTVVNVYMDNVNLGPLTTDANGYASTVTKVPALPSSDYLPNLYYWVYAITTGGVTGYESANYPFYLYPSTEFNVTTGSYVPNGAMITVYNTALNPTATYSLSVTSTPSDSYTSNILNYAVPVVGTEIATNFFMPAANGTLIIEFPFMYNPSLTSSESVTIDFSSASVTYNTVGVVTDSGFPDTATSVTSVAPGGSVSVPTINDLIPYTATLFYPTVTNVYSLYMAPATNPSAATLITFSNGKSYFTSASSTGLSFTAPSATGVYNVYIDYYGTPASDAAANALDYFVFVVSSPTGTPQLFMYPMNGQVYAGLTNTYFIGYNLPSSSPNIYLVINGPGYVYDSTSGTDANGVISFNSGPIYVASGKYQVYIASSTDISGSPVTTPIVSSTFTVYPAFDPYYSSTTQGAVGTTVDLDWEGLASNTLYNVYFNNQYLTSGYTEYYYGTLYISATVPLVPPGSYNVTIAPASDPTAIVGGATTFSFEVIQTPNIFLFPGNFNVIGNAAFPGEIVNFYWFPSTVPHAPTPTSSPSPDTTYYGPIYVTVYLNGTAYTTITANYGPFGPYLSGSFVMPNAPAGSYWALSFGWTQAVYTIGKQPSNGSTVQNSYIGKSYTFLGLAQGNGALLTGITPDEIATLQAQITSTISTSMQVPLSELNASVVAINNAVATIKTKFGNMTASLTAINATVQSINNGMATVMTDLNTIQVSLVNLNATVLSIANNVVLLNTSIGQVKTTLNSLNAKIVAINGTVATIQTDIGTLNTSLASINAQLTSIQGDIATIQTSLGTIQASLNSLNAKIVAINGTVATIKTDIGTINTSLASINAQLTSIQGNIATIQTSLGTIQGTVTSINGSVATIKTQLGTLQTSVNGVTSSVNAAKSSISNAVTFEVLIIVLVIITLVIAIGTLLIANRMVRRLEELKKQ